jgi:uncharacterized protein YdeI (YjbR/CyaY-like superfamily)
VGLLKLSAPACTIAGVGHLASREDGDTAMETIAGVAVVEVASRDQWRAWLEDNCTSVRSAWLRIFGQRSSTPSVRFHDAIEDALCFGWVDSKAVKRLPASCYLLFSPRNPKSTWGRVNRQRAEKMITQGLMRPPGQAAIDLARRTGSWDALAEAQNLVVPPDLQVLFDADEAAARNFSAFPPSSRRLILEWIMTARRSETRARRIRQTVDQARINVRAHH